MSRQRRNAFVHERDQILQLEQVAVERVEEESDEKRLEQRRLVDLLLQIVVAVAVLLLLLNGVAGTAEFHLLIGRARYRAFVQLDEFDDRMEPLVQTD